jgi:hypothetical protein
LAYPAFQPKQHGALVLQRVFRGGRDRDRLLLEHCCAMVFIIQSQSLARGYLARRRMFKRSAMPRIEWCSSFSRNLWRVNCRCAECGTTQVCTARVLLTT